MYARILAVFLMLCGASAMAAEEPEYRLVSRDGSIEIRDYAPLIIAEIPVTSEMSRASNAGFRPLANFIFGDNTAPSGGAGEIAMTTPVTQTRTSEIAMTSPVTQTGDASDWRVGFIMPSEYTMETLPRPNDPRIEISERPARRLAAIRFSGGPGEARFLAEARTLRTYLESEGHVIVGDPIFARYDPPWIPPPFRRNEVLIEIEVR